MEEESWRWDHGRDIMEQETWWRNHKGRIWEASGGILETSGVILDARWRNLGDILEASEGILEASEPLGNIKPGF